MRKFLLVKLFAPIILFSLFSVNPLFAYNLNLDFGETHGTPSSTYGAAASQAGDWNTLGLGTTSSGIVDINGTATPVNISVTALFLGDGDFCSGDIKALSGDNFYNRDSDDDWEIELSDLNNSFYDVYLYAPFNTAVPTGDMNINGTDVNSIDGNPTSCSLIENTNFVSVQVSVTDGTLTVTGTSTASYGGLAGLQLVESQEPPAPASIPTLSEWGMIILSMILAGSALWVMRRRQIS